MGKPSFFAPFAASVTRSARDTGHAHRDWRSASQSVQTWWQHWRDPRDPFATTRWRLLVWIIVVAAIIILIAGALVYLTVARTRAQDVDQRLMMVAHEQQGLLTRHERDEHEGYFPDAPDVVLFVRSPDGQVLVDARVALPGFPDRASLDLALSGQANFAQVDVVGTPLRVYSTPLIEHGQITGVVQAGTSLGPQLYELHELLIILLFGGLAGLVLAAGGGFLLVELALAPARQAFRRQQQFVADASHELRTPVALIKATTEVLARGPDHAIDADADLLAEIGRETDHLGRLIEDLLQLARLDSGQFKAELGPVALSDVAQEAAEQVNRLDRARNRQVTIAVEPNVWVHGDLGRLRQILLILLDNAVKHTPPGEMVTLRLRQEHHWARLAVVDTGDGIAREHLPFIFERFYRVDQTRSRVDGGVGLGLAIARELVELQGGRIKAESVPGQGSTFTVWLPLAKGR